MNRREFIKGLLVATAGLFLPYPFLKADAFSLPDARLLAYFLKSKNKEGSQSLSEVFRIRDIPAPDFSQSNYHQGLEGLLGLLGKGGVKFYGSEFEDPLSGKNGIIAKDDIVLIKVNAVWAYRGCTNSDLIRGLIQRVLDHPDGFCGEVVLIENGQGWGSFNSDQRTIPGDDPIQANAENPSHSFQYLVDEVFDHPKVSCFLFDPIRFNFISQDDHTNHGYRQIGIISYPCFTTRNGNRVELKEGIYAEGVYKQNLKWINVPVLKEHYGSGFTAALKNTYGIFSMPEENSYYHYDGLGEVCGRMFAEIRPADLNILDCIWVSQGSLEGYPPETTTRMNMLLAGIDPVALDYLAAKRVLYPIDHNPHHHPDEDHPQDGYITRRCLANARDTINSLGGLFGSAVTMDEEEINFFDEPLKPIISITTNQRYYGYGDRMEVRVQVINPGAEKEVDLYIAVRCGERFYFYPDWSEETKALRWTIPANLNLPPLTLLEIEMSNGLPAGDYCWYCAITEPNSYQLISQVSYAPFQGKNAGMLFNGELFRLLKRGRMVKDGARKIGLL